MKTPPLLSPAFHQRPPAKPLAFHGGASNVPPLTPLAAGDVDSLSRGARSAGRTVLLSSAGHEDKMTHKATEKSINLSLIASFETSKGLHYKMGGHRGGGGMGGLSAFIAAAAPPTPPPLLQRAVDKGGDA